MKRSRHIVSGLLLLAVAGCGSGISGTTLAEAQEYCRQTDPSYTDDLWETDLIVWRTFRDEGMTKTQALAVAAEGCRLVSDDESEQEACGMCAVRVVDALW